MKTHYIVLIFIGMFIIGGVTAEIIKEITISKASLDYLTAKATDDKATVEVLASSLIEKGVIAQQNEDNIKIYEEFRKEYERCINEGRIKECLTAIKTTRTN